MAGLWNWLFSTVTRGDTTPAVFAFYTMAMKIVATEVTETRFEWETKPENFDIDGEEQRELCEKSFLFNAHQALPS